MLPSGMRKLTPLPTADWLAGVNPLLDSTARACRRLALFLSVFVVTAIRLPAADSAKPSEPKPTVSVLGAVHHPGRYVWSAGLTIDALLLKAGGLTPDARKTARVIRSTARSTRDNLSVDLAKDPNFELMANDLIRFERNEPESPSAKPSEGSQGH